MKANLATYFTFIQTHHCKTTLSATDVRQLLKIWWEETTWRPHKGEGKAIPVTGRKGSLGCETLRFPRFLDNQRTDGGKVVSLTRQLPLTPQEHSVAGRIKSIEKPSDLIMNQTHDLPACSLVPQPTILPCPPLHSRKVWHDIKMTLT
jgi:hypothetical protein